MCRFRTFAFCAVALWPAAVAAQPASTADPVPALTIREGMLVDVVTREGETLRGAFAGQAPLTIRLTRDGRTVVVDSTSIVRITTRHDDPVGDGILRGLLIGAGVGVALGLAGADCFSGCGFSGDAMASILGGMGAGIGAGAGFLIDAAHMASRTVYQRGDARFRLVPAAASDHAGVDLVWAWGR